MRPESSFSTGEALRKPIKDDMKTQQDEMTNARLAQKHRSGWVNFTCQKALCNISLAINVSLRIENGIQHTNYQLNNTYEDTHDKEKDPFCLKSVFFCYLW